ncbi:hypothetical protein KAU33_16170 [Candidatus Dependentiae bacterium]|nr:hypothetical protein [Candidatus Dependentiae bacterium]
MISTKRCYKCHETKSLDEFHNRKTTKDGKDWLCKECSKKDSKIQYQKDIEKSREQSRKYSREHKDEIRKQRGHKSMYENKNCAQYLGIVIGERLCRHLFKNVQVMPTHNTGFDIICNKGEKIEIKTSCMCLEHGKYPYWGFNIGRNKIADFFILVAFDNIEDLNPIHLWMIPGSEINNNSGKSIRPSTVHKWNQWERSIEEIQLCCNELKEEK